MNRPVFPEIPYAAPAGTVADAPVRETELADRGLRLAAVFLDGLFAGLAMVPFFIGLFAGIGPDGNMDMGVGSGIAMALGGCACPGVIAWTGVVLWRGGDTSARRRLGIRVVRRDGSHCGLARIFFARYLPVTVLGMVPFVGGLVSLVDALLIFRDDRRCLHDEIADTIVIKA